MSFLLEKSTDGGRTFREVDAPHADHHDLWIDPTDPDRMINANDGGANVSTNGGRTWTSQAYPTAQIYRVATTADFPYHVCGAQQDNTTVCVPSDGGRDLSPGIGRPGRLLLRRGGRRERVPSPRTPGTRTSSTPAPPTPSSASTGAPARPGTCSPARTR